MRFPGFEGEWVEKRLGEVSIKINSGKTPLGGEAAYTKDGVIFIRSQNVNNDKLDLANFVFISEEINSKMQNSIVRPNDILLNITGASLGRSCVVPYDFITGNVNQHVCIIRVNEENNPKFIQPILSSDKGQNIFQSLQTGSGREGLNFENIKGIEIFLPSLFEQKKIASFLSKIDSRIQTQSKIITQLQTLMLSLVDHLFNQHVRFKDDRGNGFPDWEEKKLAEVCEVNPRTSSLPNSFAYVDLESVVSGSLSKTDKMSKKDAPSRAQRLLRQNDILFQMVRPYQKNNFYFDKEGDYVASTGYAQLRTKQNPKFIYYYLHFKKFVDDVIERCTGTSYPAINSTDLANILINLPIQSEQDFIANCLSSLDKKIETEKKILQLYEGQKKYLLQNMFI